MIQDTCHDPFAHTADDSERTAGAIAHLSALCALIGVPFGNILGPAVVWVVKKDDSEFVVEHCRSALNFQITLSLAFLATAVAMLALVISGDTLTLFSFIPVLILFGVCSTIFMIVAAVRARSGEPYRYPFALPWV